MPILTGTYTNRVGFLQVLKDFGDNPAYPNWVTHSSDGTTTSNYVALKYTDPDYGNVLYYNFMIYSNLVHMNITTDWSTSWKNDYRLAHPGNTFNGTAGQNYCYTRVYNIRDEGTVTGYTLITDGHYIAMIVEHTPGVYSHMVIGRNSGGPSRAVYACTATGWYDSAQGDSTDNNHSWLGSSSSSTAYTHQFVVDPGDGVLRGCNNYNTSVTHQAFDSSNLYYIFEGYQSASALHTFLYSRFPGVPANRNFLVPIPLLARINAPAGGYYNRCGYVPGVAMTSIRYNNPGDTISVGSEDYLLFPMRSKSNSWDITSDSVPNSYDFAYAYKVV